MTKRPLLLTCAALMASAGAASAQTSEAADASVHVAANGSDVLPCGGISNPCRSISFGIANASPGATIIVGPGRYGDLNGDGFLGAPGEETGQVGSGCQCIVIVDKAVRILSTHGSAVTVIDASSLAAPTLPVLITASEVQLGRREHGFLLRGWPNFTAVYVFAATNVRVAGNIATGSANGFSLDGGRGNLLEHNFAYGNTVGFELGGTDQIVRFNRASGNVLGFIVYGNEITIAGNIASTNDDSGFVIAGSPGVVLKKNLATGNRTAGFRIESGATPLINRNNIYGNFCGIFNRSDTTIDATDNYWGASSGPGPDPADDVCNDEVDDITVFEPFSKRPIPVPTKNSGKDDEH